MIEQSTIDMQLAANMRESARELALQAQRAMNDAMREGDGARANYWLKINAQYAAMVRDSAAIIDSIKSV